MQKTELSPMVKIEKGGIVPCRKTSGAAGYDLYVPCDTNVSSCNGINNGRTVIPLNIRLAIPEGYEGLINARSGFTAHGIVGINCYSYESILGRYERESDGFKEAAEKLIGAFDADVLEGKIDSDHRGVISVVVKNNSLIPFVILAGTRIAQITFVALCERPLTVVDELDETERNEGGFGSTGTGIEK